MEILIILGYLTCSVVSFGIVFGHFQNNPNWKSIAEEGYRSDMGLALYVALFGPIGLIVSILLTGFCPYGLKFR